MLPHAIQGFQCIFVNACITCCYRTLTCIPLFCLHDLIQLALIKSHLGAFDSKVPLFHLSNQIDTQDMFK